MVRKVSIKMNIYVWMTLYYQMSDMDLLYYFEIQNLLAELQQN